MASRSRPLPVIILAITLLLNILINDSTATESCSWCPIRKSEQNKANSNSTQSANATWPNSFHQPSVMLGFGNGTKNMRYVKYDANSPEGRKVIAEVNKVFGDINKVIDDLHQRFGRVLTMAKVLDNPKRFRKMMKKLKKIQKQPGSLKDKMDASKKENFAAAFFEAFNNISKKSKKTTAADRSLSMHHLDDSEKRLEELNNQIDSMEQTKKVSTRSMARLKKLYGEASEKISMIRSVCERSPEVC